MEVKKYIFQEKVSIKMTFILMVLSKVLQPLEYRGSSSYFSYCMI